MQFPETVGQPAKSDSTALGRRSFLGLLGVAAGVVLLPGCKNDDEDVAPGAINLGSGDEGLMRYAYSLEVFMSMVTRMAVAGRGQIAEEKNNFQSMQFFHESYRDLFKAALNQEVPENLEFETTKIAFSDKTRLHQNMIAFTDLAASAYMDMAGRFTDPAKKMLAAKIAASCSRQSTRLRWTRNNNWAERAATDANSMALSSTEPKSPAAVVAALDPFFVSKLNVSTIS